jgi:hypothetical protein
MNRRVVIGIIAAIAVVSGLAIAVAWQDNSTGSASQPSDEDRAIDAVIEQIDSGPRSTFQDELLADGQLTETEYDVAFAKYSECVTLAGGILPGGTAKSRWGVYDAGVRVPGLEDGSPNRDAQARVLECERLYFDRVGQRWQVTHMIPDEAVDEEFAKIPGCMRARGVEPPGDDPDGWGFRYLVELAGSEESGAFMECLLEANEALGMPHGTAKLP